MPFNVDVISNDSVLTSTHWMPWFSVHVSRLYCKQEINPHTDQFLLKISSQYDGLLLMFKAQCVNAGPFTTSSIHSFHSLGSGISTS